MQVGTYITFRDTFGREIDEAGLIGRVEQLSLHDCLQSIGKISFLLAHGESKTADSFVLGGLRSPGARFLADGMIRYAGRTLIFEKRLLVLARTAILHAEQRDPDGFRRSERLHLFVEALLGVADVYDPSGEPALQATREEQEAWFSSFRLRRAGIPQRRLKQSITRAVRIYIDIAASRPELLSVQSPSDAFEARTGMPLERYFAIAFASAIRFLGWDRKPESWLLATDYWRNSTVTEEEFLLVAGELGVALADIRTEFEEAHAAGRTSIDEVWPFIIHPLIEIEPRVYLAVDLEALGDAIVGDGLFWKLKPDPGATKKEKDEFGEALGHLFEAHCVETTKRVYNPNTETRLMFEEKRYAKNKDGPDIAIFERATAVFIEIGIDRPNLRDTIVRGNLESFDADVRKILVKRAEQLDRKIDDFYAGSLVYEGVDPASIKRLYPVVCLIDGFPLGTPLYRRMAGLVLAGGYLQQEQAERLTVISAEEFETLLALVERGEQMTDVLRSHGRSLMREETLRDYLISERRVQPTAPSFLEEEFGAIGVRLAAQLFGAEAAERFAERGG